MSHVVPVPLADHPYEVKVGENEIDSCGAALRAACGGGSRCALITDAHVAPLYADKVAASLHASGTRTETLIVPAGERTKSFACLEDLCQRMSRAGLDRTSFVVALGGGVVGDLAGFAAAIYLRGLPYAQLPTTLLAQVDSSVGGKTGINIETGKNLVGAFHQPRLVIADTTTLSTLPPREFNEGMAECIKHGVIRDASLVQEIPSLAESDRPRLVARNVEIKARVVVADEFEQNGERALLNFGHTVGHAIEQAAGYGRFLHGEAISIGMAAALWLSVRHAGLPQSQAGRVLDCLKSFALPCQLPKDISVEKILEALRRDKKFESGQIRFVLTSALGTAFVSKDISPGHITDAIQAVQIA